jgi:hypothetical protein
MNGSKPNGPAHSCGVRLAKAQGRSAYHTGLVHRRAGGGFQFRQPAVLMRPVMRQMMRNLRIRIRRLRAGFGRTWAGHSSVSPVVAMLYGGR